MCNHHLMAASRTEMLNRYGVEAFESRRHYRA